MVAFMLGGIGHIVSVNISKYLLISVNINTFVGKKNLNPEITFLFINYMLKKPCLKFPKSETKIFGLKMTPPLELFQKFIIIGSTTLP